MAQQLLRHGRAGRDCWQSSYANMLPWAPSEKSPAQRWCVCAVCRLQFSFYKRVVPVGLRSNRLFCMFTLSCLDVAMRMTASECMLELVPDSSISGWVLVVRVRDD